MKIVLKARGMLDNALPLTSVEDMARHYADIIRKIDNSDSYHLLGASMGCAVTYETARVLCQQQPGAIDGPAASSAITLCLLEAPLILNETDAALWLSNPVQNLLMNANFLLISLLNMDPQFRQKKAAGQVQWSTLEIKESDVLAVAGQDTLTALVKLIQSRGVGQSETLLCQRLSAMAAVHENNLHALRNYRPQPWPSHGTINAVLMRTQSASAVSDEVYNPDYLRKVQKVKGSLAPFLDPWSRILPQLQKHTIAGDNHFEAMSSQAAALELTESLLDFIDRVPASEQAPEQSRGAVAIIGLSGCFPGSSDTEAFWQLLKEGQCAISEVPSGRIWKTEEIYAAEPHPNKSYTQYGAFLQDVDYFDPAFFRISVKEAEMMETSERLLLQESWKALENAGIDPLQLSGKEWGVFCGGGGDYTLLLKDVMGFSPHVTQSAIAARIAYSLNLKGPVVCVDAACASSLLAIAQASDHILQSKCESALVGGVMVHNTPNLLIAGCQQQLYLIIAYRDHLFERKTIEDMGDKICACLTYILEFPQ